MLRTFAFILAVSMLPSSTHAQNQKLFFQPPTYVGRGQMVAADFNGDGKLDLISADGTVQLGNGDGTFKTGTAWSVSGQNYSGFLAAGDFNGDGKPDLVVSLGTSLYVLPGNGDGTFQQAIATNIGTGLGAILVADVNGDGKPDVLGNGACGLMIFLGK